MTPLPTASEGHAVRFETPADVAEFQGLYGAYHVSELLLQKIWLRGAFDASRARTTTGDVVAILHPGTWNRLSGPDFREARLRLGDREVIGDIEVHFHAAAWEQHGHHADPAYGGVVLHVVLFPPPRSAPLARRADGSSIPLLVLVDLLWHDLEEYATDDAVAALSSRDAIPLVEQLLALEPAARADAIRRSAEARWRDKVRYAQLRIDRCGWEEACHLTALEILGYRANREAMLRVGTHFPWRAWSGSATPPSVEALIEAGGAGWTLRGVRPANQPRLRLAQYARWMSAVADWPLRLERRELPPLAPDDDSGGTIAQRRRAGFAALQQALAADLTGDELGGLRFDTFVVNLVLPFLAARRPGDAARAHAWWRLWAPGDVAEVLLEASRRLAAPGARDPRTNETVQGLLGLHLERTRSHDAAPAG